MNRVVAPDELLPTCRKLAEDILSTDPTTRLEIKRIMDAGWHTTLEEGLATEHEASVAHGRTEVSADKVAARRAAIQERGRSHNP